MLYLFRLILRVELGYFVLLKKVNRNYNNRNVKYYFSITINNFSKIKN